MQNMIPQRAGMLGTRPLETLVRDCMAAVATALANDVAVNLDIDAAQHERIKKAINNFSGLMEESFCHVIEAAANPAPVVMAEPTANVINLKEYISG